MLVGKRMPSSSLCLVVKRGKNQLVTSGLSPKIERKWRHVSNFGKLNSKIDQGMSVLCVTPVKSQMISFQKL